MLTAADVQRVARTAQPYRISDGASLTIDDVIKMTTADDWEGDLYELYLGPATEIALQVNATHGLAPALSLPTPAKSVSRRRGTAKVN